MTPVSALSPLQLSKNLTIKNRVLRSNISGRWDNEDGSLTQTRLNWERMFAEGGVGAVITSYTPVLMNGRIIAGYATIHKDAYIPLWAKVAEAVHQHDCKFLMQLSHGGRQIDVPGVQNQHRPALSSTDQEESLNGFPTRAASPSEVQYLINAFAKAAWRAREAGIDGVELHAANGYLFTQFLSSGINNREDAYGGNLFNRARFLLDVIQAIRAKVGSGYHLQVKISAIDYNNVIPTEGAGNSLDDTIQVAKWCQAAGADALHVSMGSLFPHPLNPPGGFDFETITATYDTMISSGSKGLRNYVMFRTEPLRPLFRWIWFRMKRNRPVEGVNAQEALAIKRAVSIPVICTGGFQSRSLAERYLSAGYFDAVSIARSLIANPDLVKYWEAGWDVPPEPCTFCNKCLLNAPENPLGCYEVDRFDGSREKMVDALMKVYAVKPELKVS